MGTACLCGNGAQNAATWQSNTGPALGLQQGFYSGAVNNVLFKSRSKSALTCGETCGQCYDLVTSGTNAYVDGAGGGSLITMMVVDACYGQGAEKWCSGGPSSGPVQDTFGCTDHFDIQTDPTRSDVPATGMDGQEWSREFCLRTTHTKLLRKIWLTFHIRWWSDCFLSRDTWGLSSSYDGCVHKGLQA